MTIQQMFLGAGAGGPPPTLVGSIGTQSVNVASYSQPIPSGAAGDLLLLILTSPSRNFTTPSGWTELFEAENSLTNIYIYYKTAASASENNFTITMEAATNIYSGIFRFTGANTIPTINSFGSFNYNSTGVLNYPAVANGMLSDYNIQFAYFYNPDVILSTPNNSTPLLINDDSSVPSFFTFFDIGTGQNKSSTFTAPTILQPPDNPAHSAQIRIRAA